MDWTWYSAILLKVCSISECTICQTLKQMGYSCEGRQWVQSRKLRLVKLGWYQTGEMLPGVISPDFCCSVQIAG